MFKFLDFQPFPGFGSPHLQMVLANFSPSGKEPPSTPWLVPLEDGDHLSCQISTPLDWKPNHKTMTLLHGLGGSHQSAYMIRLARKFFQKGIRVVRINLRGCGSGRGLNNRTYHSGNSSDIEAVLTQLKKETPNSPIHFIGVSLGGSIGLKMAAELGIEAGKLLDRLIAICPVVDFVHSVLRLSQRSNTLYHRYYLNRMIEHGQRWLGNKPISSIYAFDDTITAPLWGYANANEYYEKCSPRKFLHLIRIPCDILFAADDPFIDYHIINHAQLPSNMNIWVTAKGSHVGFLGRPGRENDLFWMDQLMLNWNV